MSQVFDCRDPDRRKAGLAAAASAFRRGALVVLPTDSAYAVTCDAFNTAATAALRSAKGRPPGTPLPVLIGKAGVVDALTRGLTDDARQLIAALWPGPLTLLARQQPSLIWDVDPSGTVMVRMPLHPLALELLAATGPTAATGANFVGLDVPMNCDAARDQLGEAVAVYLDAGPLAAGRASAVVDVTAAPPTVLRPGSVPPERLEQICESLGPRVTAEPPA
ncbi:MAG: hypothetical protein RLZ55_1002 [Actinomycetota bacterium]|jgi:tRNA threonylcarbamoyl adenosine modification protein (Sua5/YciO/YrdC/YwlC family)